MAGLSNKDSSFFEIRSPDISIDENLLTADMISLSIVEEMKKMVSGNLTLYDPNSIYSKILRNGVRLYLSWGYKKWDANQKAVLLNTINLDEFSGSIERRGVEVYIQQPNGSGEQSGIITYNCSFTGVGLRGDDQIRWHRKGTKGDVVATCLDELGVAFKDIRFSRMNEQITPDTEIVQWESNFAFLTRMASREWRTLFMLNYTPKGEIVAVFIDPDKLETSPYQKQILGGQGASNYFDYKGKVSNVISYKWLNNEGASGMGQNIQMIMVDGQMTFIRYVMEDDKVRGYRLVPQRMTDELTRRGMDQGISGQMKLFTDWQSVTDFEQIKRYFEPIESSTAPQGYGYKINIRAFGNPMCTASNRAKFGDGFPDRIGNSNTKWYIRKVAHSINQSGYFQDIEIVDAYTFTPTGVLM